MHVQRAQTNKCLNLNCLDHVRWMPSININMPQTVQHNGNTIHAISYILYLYLESCVYILYFTPYDKHIGIFVRVPQWSNKT